MKLEVKELMGTGLTIEVSLAEMEFISGAFKSFWNNLTDNEKEKLYSTRTAQIEQFFEGSKLFLDNLKELSNQKKEEE